MTQETEYLPVWEPGDELPKWAAKLQEPFPLDEIGLRPQVWCKDCRESRAKYCGKEPGDPGGFGVQHTLKKCKDCGQRLSQAHMHLYYVGHAHATRRLLDTDPRWYWRPMARDIDPEILKAAIATGSQFIIEQVMNAAPPKITEIDVGNGRVERGMWIELIVHDDNGNPVVTPGYGDAKGKAWGPDALKEMIGDGIRNAGMRRGLALGLWESQDLEDARKANSEQSPDGYAARAALFDNAAGEENQDQQAGRRKPAARQAKADPPAGINPEAQAAADLIWKLATVEHVPMDQLKAAHDQAREKKILGLHCAHPGTGEKTTVLRVSAKAREELEAWHAKAGAEG